MKKNKRKLRLHQLERTIEVQSDMIAELQSEMSEANREVNAVKRTIRNALKDSPHIMVAASQVLRLMAKHKDADDLYMWSQFAKAIAGDNKPGSLGQYALALATAYRMTHKQEAASVEPCFRTVRTRDDGPKVPYSGAPPIDTQEVADFLREKTKAAQHLADLAEDLNTSTLGGDPEGFGGQDPPHRPLD